MQGRKNYLYVNTNTYASPTYLEIKQARDVNHERSRSESDDSCRGFDTASTEVGQQSYSCSFDAVYKRGDAAMEALEAAFNSGTPIGILVRKGKYLARASQAVLDAVEATGKDD